jgi:hypothetical protein
MGFAAIVPVFGTREALAPFCGAVKSLSPLKNSNQAASRGFDPGVPLNYVFLKKAAKPTFSEVPS